MKPRLRPPTAPLRPGADWRRNMGGRALREGHGAEWVAALWLMLKGYQVLAFRLKARGAEIDILARRGRILAVIEVKRRSSMEAALAAVTPDQASRLRLAGEALLRSRPAFARLELRLDMVALAPGRFPRHVRNLDF